MSGAKPQAALEREPVNEGRPRSWVQTLGLVAVLAVLLVGLNYTWQSWRHQQTDQRAAIQAVLDGQAQAWNAGDLEGFMAGYWQSPEMTFFSGKDKQAGWQPTLERYQKKYQAEGREMGQLTFSEIQIEQLDATHAWVRGRWQLVTSKDTPGGLFTLIFQRLPEGWRIVHDHTSD